MALLRQTRMSIEDQVVVEFNIARYFPWVQTVPYKDFRLEKGNRYVILWLLLSGTSVKSLLDILTIKFYPNNGDLQSACIRLALEVLIETEFCALFDTVNHCCKFGFKVNHALCP